MKYLQEKRKNRTGLVRKGWVFCAFIWLSVLTAVAQEQKIALPRQTLSVREVMAEIKNQTEYSFVVNHAQFDDSRMIYFPKRTHTLREILSLIITGTNHTYQIRGKQILFIALKKAELQGEIRKEPTPVAAPASSHKRYNSVFNERFEQEVQAYNSRLMEQPTEQKQPDTPLPSVETKTEADTGTVEPSALVKNALYAVPSQEYALMYTQKKVAHLQPDKLRSQPTVGVKVNVLYGIAALAPNVAFEFGLSRKTSLDLSVAWNPWGKDKASKTNKMVHLIAKPEVRYWLCERFNGHFFGVHPFYWDYNVSGKDIPLLFDKEYRYEGNAFGAGISYGYHWMWNKHWGLEMNVGVGGSFMKYKKFEAIECGEYLGEFRKKYFGPTSAGVKVMFMIK